MTNFALLSEGIGNFPILCYRYVDACVANIGSNSLALTIRDNNLRHSMDVANT